MNCRVHGFVSRGSQHVGWWIILKTQTEEVNQGSDLDLLVSLVMSGACLSSKQERVVLCCKQSTVSMQRAIFWRICYEVR